jgi:Tannase and feruloyl esterase
MRHRLVPFVLAAMVTGFVVVPWTPSAQTSSLSPSVSCESLAKIALPDATITSAGAPANYMIHLHAAQTAIAQALDRTPASRLPPEKFRMIQASAVAACDQNDGINPNLGPFFKRGGKLLMYHGWSDQHISPVNSINYYNSVLKAVSDPTMTSSSIRLFIAPGMAHCGGGDGPDTFDRVAAIRAWVENGTAPDRLVATKGSAGPQTRSRPLCPYPQVALVRHWQQRRGCQLQLCRAARPALMEAQS